MRYMMLVYSTEPPGGLKPEEAEQIRMGHRRVMDEAARKGVLMGGRTAGSHQHRDHGPDAKRKGAGDRRTFRRNQGASRRILHSGMREPGRGHRLGGQNPNRLPGGKVASKSGPCACMPHRDWRLSRSAATLRFRMDDIRSAVESVFRQESGRIVASLIRISGSFDRAEEAMQESFASALASWPVKGIPDNPAAWIMTAAHRKLIDAVRKENNAARKAGFAPLSDASWLPASPTDADFDRAAAMHFPDDRLRLIFTCCHPALESPRRRLP